MQLRYFEHLKGPEIGERLGVNRSTVSRTLDRAESRLKRVLKYCL
nr:MAG TPA: Transcriptional regulator, contains sigma factor-related N-terminal domain [Caudoviricetes sp.]